MSKWAQGVYQVINQAKYVGNGMPRYRSGWEHSFMRFCDTNDNILQWASESINIPYRNPITGKQSIYVPDFLITYRDKNNQLKAEMIEIKPKKQSVEPVKKKRMTKQYLHEVVTWGVNQAKWKAATEYALDRGWEFKVLTEEHLGL